MSDLLSVIKRSTRLSDNTKADYSRCVERFLSFAGDNPAGWNGATVEEWRDRLSATMQPDNINKHLYALRYATKRLAALGAGHDFARAAESLPVHGYKKRQAMAMAEVEALFSTCNNGDPYDLRDRAAMTIALRTGLRANNLQRIKYEGIDGRSLRVIQKGNRPHIVILDDSCLATIEAWSSWAEISTGAMFRRIQGPLMDGSYKLGKPIHGAKWFNKMLANRSDNAGIRRIYPHLFRHTFVSWALEAGIPPHRIMQQTGHASMVTLSRYATDLRAESDPIGGYLPDV